MEQLIGIFCLFGVFFLIELYLNKENIIKNFFVDFLFYILLQGVLLSYLTFEFIDVYFKHLELTSLNLGKLPYLFQFAILIIVIEFVIYWTHRLFHTVPFLWNFHKIHHSTKDLHAFSAYRTHFFEALFLIMLKAFLFSLMNASDYVIVAYIFFSRFHALFIHSSITYEFKWLKYFFVTPNRHKLHHSTKSTHFNSNFGDRLIIFDLLFNTAKDFKNSEQLKGLQYGVEANYPKNYFSQLFQPFKRFLSRFK